jgi:hypothetical protein
MSSYNVFFHDTSEFSDNQFAAAKKEKETIQQIYNKFNESELKPDSISGEYIILDYDVEVLSIGESSFSLDALKSYTRKYTPKLKKYIVNGDYSIELKEEILLSANDTKIVPAYINSQYIGELGQDQFYNIARQCFLINLVYRHFINGSGKKIDEIEKIKMEIENPNSRKKIIVLFNDCRLKLTKPMQKIKQGFDAVIDETNHFLKKIIEKNIIVITYHKNYIDESVLIDQIIEEEKIDIEKELKEHFKNDMLLLNNKTILDEKDKGYTTDWLSNFIFPPKLIDIENNKCILKQFEDVKETLKKKPNKNQQQSLTLFSKPTVEEIDKLFFYDRVKEDDLFYKIEFFIPQDILEERLYKEIVWISHNLLNESITQKQ